MLGQLWQGQGKSMAFKLIVTEHADDLLDNI